MQQDLEFLKYPIGRFEIPDSVSPEALERYISTIRSFPEKIRGEVDELSDEKLDTPYRPEGWTIRQVVHHCADSHMNAIIRLKLALTEENPIIKPYFEDRWAELPDSELSVGSSLKILEGLHERWAFLLSGLTENQLSQKFTHPEHGHEFPIAVNIANYAWHCEHHLAHIVNLKKSGNW